MSSHLISTGWQRIIDALAIFDIKVESAELLAKTTSAVNTFHLRNDSREISKGDIFCSIIGHQQDGRKFVEKAMLQGAVMIIAQCKEKEHHGQITWHREHNVPVIEFYQLDHYLFALASAYYLNPQNKMKMIGITGTNGKTSTSQIIASLLDDKQDKCAVIGTVGYGRLGKLKPLENTTPGASKLVEIFSGFVEQSTSHVAMEVSSHALEQRRVESELFDMAIFTNLSRDHLDYHQTMKAYAEAKFQLFSGKANQIAIINGDDEQAQRWLEKGFKSQPVIVYGRSNPVAKNQQYILATDIKHSVHGVSFTIKTHIGNVAINSPLMGDFNIDNLLAAIAVLIAENKSLTDIASAVAKLKPIVGRMESFTANNLATAVVDYAHTPDALNNALQACRLHCQGALWVVFGCGGNRDKGKRKLMGQVAENSADHVIITNDNPRHEQPAAIADDILSGCQHPKKITVLLDRQQAVLSALKKAAAKDIVLLAGKGHEKFIVIGNEQIPYDERAFVRKTYQQEALS